MQHLHLVWTSNLNTTDISLLPRTCLKVAGNGSTIAMPRSGILRANRHGEALFFCRKRARHLVGRACALQNLDRYKAISRLRCSIRARSGPIELLVPKSRFGGWLCHFVHLVCQRSPHPKTVDLDLENAQYYLLRTGGLFWMLYPSYRYSP